MAAFSSGAIALNRSGSIRVKQYLAGDDRSHHFQDPREITNTYALGGLRVAIGGSSSESTFTPEDAVDFMCANARNFIQSTKGVGPGKMFNDDRMRVATFYTWMAFASLQSQEARLLQAHDHLKDMESTFIIQNSLSIVNQAKLEETCVENTVLKMENERLNWRLKAAEASWRISKRPRRRELKRTDEYIDALRVEYVRGSTETKFFIAKVDPNFDFDRQEEVCTEELSRTAFLHPIESAPPEEEAPEDSLEKAKLILMTRMTRLKWLILSSD
ncbi:hypothetical protein ACOSQ2_017354 [Xanthoceras sorbifolium]